MVVWRDLLTFLSQVQYLGCRIDAVLEEIAKATSITVTAVQNGSEWFRVVMVFDVRIVNVNPPITRNITGNIKQPPKKLTQSTETFPHWAASHHEGKLYWR
jgi:hypothetical protein